MKLLVRISRCRIVRNLVPYEYYLLCRERRKKIDPQHIQYILALDEFKEYCTLCENQLEKRIEEEHRRAVAIDEKTFKLTLSLSFVVAVLGLELSLFQKLLPPTANSIMLNSMIAIAFLYILSAGLVALGALSTLPSYGYGTKFLLEQRSNRQKVLAENLSCQEIMNDCRHLRNKIVYMAMRNAFVMILAGFVIFVAMYLYQFFSSGS